MAKNKNQKITKKQKKKIKKEVVKGFKKRPKLYTTLIIILIVAMLAFIFYAYKQGWLNGKKDNGDFDYIFEQSEDGFYYYTGTNMNLGDYYYGIKDIEDSTLETKLSTIIDKDFNPVSYGDARYILAMSDRDPKNSENVIGIYDNDIIANYWIGTGAGAWQREHVWPNSKLGIPRVGTSSKNQGSDLHNLRAITGINQTRSNRYFEEGSGKAITIGKEAFYPGDEHKGDVARILFYMTIKYDFLKLTNDTDKLINNADTNYKPEGAYAGLLNLLIKWHKEDPVSEFEMKRNDFIHKGIATDPKGKEIAPQGNRNPFIDKPELVHLIWESMSISDITKVIEDVEEVNIDIYVFIKIEILYFKENNEIIFN